MNLKKKIIIINNYIAFFVKKQYRICFSKKIAYINDEFSYVNKNACTLISKIISFWEILFNLTLPIASIFYPINLKYIIGAILFITYLTKMKELKVINLRTYFHKLFIKDAVFQFYGIVIICFNLIIILDIKSIITILLILFLFCIKVNNINNLFLYIYGFIYFFITAVMLNRYINFFVSTSVFIIIISIFYLYEKKMITNKESIVKLNKFYIININIKKLIRKLSKTPQEFMSFIFPSYIIIYLLICYTLHKIPFLSNNEIIVIVQVCIYFVIYYSYIKIRLLEYDDCFYFSITKLEFLKLNIIWIYMFKIILIIIFFMFSIFWGTTYLIILSNLKYNFQTIYSLGSAHIFILLICLSANVYVEKNKSDVTKQPEDIKKYMSFIEALFLSSMFVITSLFINLHLNKDIQSSLVNNLIRVNTVIFIIQLIIWIGAILSIIKTLNYMLIFKLNIRRRL